MIYKLLRGGWKVVQHVDGLPSASVRGATRVHRVDRPWYYYAVRRVGFAKNLGKKVSFVRPDPAGATA